MVITNACIILKDNVIPKGFLKMKDGIIEMISPGNYEGSDECFDASGKTAFPGFIDLHVHGSAGIDFMDASSEDMKKIAESLYEEGVTTFLATTLTAAPEALEKVCSTIASCGNSIPSLGGIHLEGPYISSKYKGAQNEAFIRNPDTKEIDHLQKLSGNRIRYITLAPEKEGAMNFISHCSENGITVSVGHSDASFAQVEEAITHGLTNVTHTHDAMSPHHHRHPGVVTAAFYFDSLNCEFIGDGIHVCPETLKTSYKIIGPERFMLITDALCVKHSDKTEFLLEGLPCIRREDAAYLCSGPLAGSLLTMDQGFRNMRKWCHCSDNELSRITSFNAARSIHLEDRGELAVGKRADIVLMNEEDQVDAVFSLGEKVYENHR